VTRVYEPESIDSTARSRSNPGRAWIWHGSNGWPCIVVEGSRLYVIALPLVFWHLQAESRPPITASGGGRAPSKTGLASGWPTRTWRGPASMALNLPRPTPREIGERFKLEK
jgi:hypothetical protein